MIYRFGDFNLNTSRFELSLQGVPQKVERQVYDLLCFLIANSDRVVTRDEILEAVWAGRVVSDSALSSCIKSVRKAVGDDGEHQNLIRTQHGVGFRFVGKVESEMTSPVQADSNSSLVQDIKYCQTADEVTIAYSTVGEGPPLVKAANWMSHLEYDLESPIWRHWIEALSTNNQLIRYDERGNGLSDRKVEDLSFEAMVADLEAVVDALELDRFPLFGISQGCAVSVEYAVRHPERVSCLILYGGFARGWRSYGDPVETGQREAMATLMLTGWGQDNPAFRQLFTSRFMPGASTEQMNWFNDLQQKTVSPVNAHRLFNCFGDIDVRHRLEQVSQPTLVLHARDDGEIYLKCGREFATGIADARFVTLDSANHIMLENEPAFDRFVSEVNRFLSDQ